MRKNEKVFVECKTHWMRSLFPIIGLLIFLITAIDYLMSGNTSDFKFTMVIVLIFAVVIFVQQKSSYLRMTETAIIGKIGLIWTKKIASPISKINDVSVYSGLFGKIFGFSTICISTAGSNGSEYVFKCMKNGKTLQKEFLRKVG